MSGPSFIDRLKSSRLVQVLILYLGASWVVIEVAGELQAAFDLPDWLVPVAFVLLLVGLVVMLGTAWVQSNPATDAREAAGEVPDSWEVGIGDFVGALRGGRFPHLTWGRALVGGLVAISLLFGVAGAYVLFSGSSGPPASGTPPDNPAGTALAIVPFEVSGLDQDVYGEGMITLLGTTLDDVPGTRVVESRTVLARWDERASGNRRPDLSEILDVARRVSADRVLVGDAVAAGRGVRLVADLYDVATAGKLGTAQAEGPADSLTSLVDQLSVGMARLLIAEGEPASEVQRLSSLTTTSLDALLAYVEGEHAYRRGAWEDAFGAYERAIDEDSTFALAHLRAAEIMGWEGGLGDRADVRAHQAAAQRYRQRLPARERALLDARQAHTDSDVTAIEEAEAAVRRYPDDAELWNALGELLFHLGQKALRDPEDALEPLQRAVELAPGTGPYVVHVTDYKLERGDSAGAAEAIERERALFPDGYADRDFQFELLYGSDEVGNAALRRLPERGPSGRDLAVMDALPRLPTREAYVRTVFEADPDDDVARDRYADVLLRRGKIGRLLELADPATSRGIHWRNQLVELELLPVDSLRGVDPSKADPGVALRLLLNRSDWRTYQTLRAKVDREVESMLEREPDLADDPLGPGAFLAYVEARRVWAIEGADSALALYLEAFERAPGQVVERLLWEIGRLYEETDDDAQALRYFRAAAQTFPFAALRAARLADHLGQPEEARRLYQELLIAWEGADPQFQPWLEEARGWLERVPG
jgi:TolB-like protein